MSITVKTFLWCFGIATFWSLAISNPSPYAIALVAWWLIATFGTRAEETKAKHKEELADQRRLVESETRQRVKDEEVERRAEESIREEAERLRRENQAIDKAVSRAVESKEHELNALKKELEAVRNELNALKNDYKRRDVRNWDREATEPDNWLYPADRCAVNRCPDSATGSANGSRYCQYHLWKLGEP